MKKLKSSNLRREFRLIKLGLILGLFVGIACTHQQLVGNPMLEIFQDMLLPTPVDAPAAFKAAVQLLEAKRYQEALDQFDGFLHQTGSSRWAQAAVVDSGRALEGMSRWTEALAKYHAAIDATERRAPKLQTYALYRASYCYEALADDQQTVAVLLDLLSPQRSADLTNAAVNAEIPGRLAAAYARLGEIHEAMAFYAKAESGVARLKMSGSGADRLWLGQTLYLMGKVPIESVNWENAAIVLRALDQNQKFAIEAAALGESPWSGLASRSLIGTYRDLFMLLQSPPTSKWEDPILGKRDAQRSQWNLASEILQRLNELKVYRLPEADDDSSEANDVFAFAEILTKKVQVVLQETPAGEGLTEASAARIAGRAAQAGTPRMPRVLSPDPRLEGSLGHASDTSSEKSRARPVEVVNPKTKDDPNL